MWVLYLQDAPVVKPAAVDLPVVVYPLPEEAPKIAATPRKIALRRKVKRLRADCARKRKTLRNIRCI